MSVTIEDIAKYLGIAASTVSKALNNYSDVSQETKERVLAAARDLDYHPSILLVYSGHENMIWREKSV